MLGCLMSLNLKNLRLMSLKLIGFVLLLATFVGCRQSPLSKIDIIGGHPVSEHPAYFVQLVDSATASEGFCGGTLVAPRVVVTAAHCIDPAQVRSLHVVLGMADGQNLQLNHPVKVEGVVVHPEFGNADNRNDIAVLYLEDYSNVEFEMPVVPLAFSRDSNLPETSPYQKIRVIGLGNTTSIGWLFDGVIREVELGVVPIARCDDKYGSVDHTQICAGDMHTGGVDSCQGDSGGPMLAKDMSGAWTLVGIVSYGEGCAQKSAPGVYTRVASFASFIDDAVVTLTQPKVSEDDEIVRLLKTHCFAQFGYIPFAEFQGDHRRETIYGMHLESLDLDRSDRVPEGNILDQCVITGHGVMIEASWIEVKAHGLTSPPKVSLKVTRGGFTWVSVAQTLHYREDNIHCQTAEGSVDLADLRNDTYVRFRDVFYRLGDAADVPGDSQTTWGCSFGDASVEVYELITGQGKELAARIHHRSIGTVSVKLIRADTEAEIFPRIQWETPGDGQLVLENNSATEDLFTWELTCPREFSIVFSDGKELASIPAEFGGFSLVVDAAKYKEGSVLAQSSVSLRLKSRNSADLDGCLVNGAWSLENFVP
jgi:secreted trypsin-like serine protease